MRPNILLNKSLIVEQLRKNVFGLQRDKKDVHSGAIDLGLGEILSAFPNRTFPTGAVHELSSQNMPQVAASNGFISGLLGKLMHTSGNCLWVSTKRTIYTPGLKKFGIDPSRIIFVDANRTKQALWAIEEGLKCDALSAVVGELPNLSFTESRRLQQAVEQSNVTGFIHRIQPRQENTLACVTRWRISPVTSYHASGLPGVGYPCWHVALTKVRNGQPGAWMVAWTGKRFQTIVPSAELSTDYKLNIA